MVTMPHLKQIRLSACLGEVHCARELIEISSAPRGPSLRFTNQGI